MEDPSLSLGDGTYKVFFNTESFDQVENQSLKSFLKYVQGEVTQDDLVQKMVKRMEKIKMNGEWRKQCMTLLMKERFDFARGKEEGREEGRQEGMEKGRQEGREEGREEGKEEQATAIAIGMLSHLPDEMISLYTNLPVEKVKLLREEQERNS